MNHTIKQILLNQDTFKSEIISWLRKDFNEQKNILSKLKKDKDKEVFKSVKSFKKKFNKIKSSELIESLFFRSGVKKRSKNYYAWWDENIEEVIIYPYGKKTANRSINRP